MTIGERYAYAQLVSAERSKQNHKATKWRVILDAIISGSLKVGSRTPVKGMPAWATPEVMRGGFASGSYAAGGPLLEHEIALAKSLGLDVCSVEKVRLALNTWFLTSEGIDELRLWLRDERFAIHQPEEAALAVIALLADDEPDLVRALIKKLSPFFDRLRFYPRPLDERAKGGCFVRSVNDVLKSLSNVKPRQSIVVQDATLRVWIPLYDRLIDLVDDKGLERQEWVKDAARWREDFRLACKSTERSERWSKARSPFERCRAALNERFHGRSLSEGKARRVANLVQRHREAHGEGATRDERRRVQAKQNVKVWFDDIARILSQRLNMLDVEDGLDDVSEMLDRVHEGEAQPRAPEGSEIPQSIARKVNAAQKGSVAELVSSGHIASSEVLATLLPQLIAPIFAEGFEKSAHRALAIQTYKAFHKRRSLLLLNLASQVRLEELPWVSALLQMREHSSSQEESARKALESFVSITLTHFPHVQFPNPLVEQMGVLARQAKVKAPLVQEIAADIFMGSFTPHFERAAQSASRYYAGTLYARYYDLPSEIRKGALADLCRSRAGVSKRWGSVAEKGMVLEQSMILTSHNLASLVGELELSVDFAACAERSFSYVCDRLSLVAATRHAQLISIKRAAYAFRQTVAFLSELKGEDFANCVATLERSLGDRSLEFQERFAPIMRGLYRAMRGETLSRSDCFVGWTLGEHNLWR